MCNKKDIGIASTFYGTRITNILVWDCTCPLIPLNDLSEYIMTPKGTHTPQNKPPNKVPYVPADPDSEPSLSYSSSSESSDSSDNKYYK